jgi:putative ABC transport system substrate-binding protein
MLGPSEFLVLDIFGTPNLMRKRLDLLKESHADHARVAVLSNPTHPGELSELRATLEVARALGLAIEHFDVESDDNFEPAFAATTSSRHSPRSRRANVTANRVSRHAQEFQPAKRLPRTSSSHRSTGGGAVMRTQRSLLII